METLPVTLDAQRALISELEVEELENLSVLIVNRLRKIGVEEFDWPLPWMKPLLKAVAGNGVTIWAIRELRSQGVRGVSVRNVQRWRGRLPEFKEALAAAMDEGQQILIGEARRRATGYDEPLTFKGQLTGDSVRKASDVLLMFCIKANHPEYRDNRGKGQAGDVNVNVDVAPILVLPDNGRMNGKRTLEPEEARKLLTADLRESAVDADEPSLA